MAGRCMNIECIPLKELLLEMLGNEMCVGCTQVTETPVKLQEGERNTQNKLSCFTSLAEGSRAKSELRNAGNEWNGIPRTQEG